MLIRYSNKNILKYTSAIRNKFSLISLLLNIYTKEFLAEVKGHHNLKIVFQEEKKISRIFLKEIGNAQIQSFHTPFKIIENNNDAYELRLESSVVPCNISSVEISFLKCFFNRVDSFYTTIENFYDAFLSTLDSFAENSDICISDSKQADYWKLILYLIEFEPGYVRYDYDEEHYIPKIHPIHHLDINFSNNATYKIGLYNSLSIDLFLELVNKETDCFFIHEPSHSG